MKTLLIVESPAKSKTIEKLLGSNYIVLSSFGHIRELDKENGTNKMGIEVNNNFNPIYKIMKDRSKQIKAIQEKIKVVDRVLLASDEDREGEAIAWHLAIVFKLNINDKNRICFHEITKNALENAVSNPRTIDMNMVNSQQARRILDRLVGFQISPILWKYIAPKLSAGRVQSAALKILVDAEKEINKFTEKKYYKTICLFNKKINGVLNTNFEKKEDAHLFLNDCKQSIFTISKIEKNNIERKPPPPYTTSTIQQDVGSRFGLGSKKIMSILQKLYENGHITYHRTDSTNLSTTIQNDIKNYILDKFEKKYLHLRIYKSKIKCAQEAHEAIRPTHIDIEKLDDSYDALEQKVYDIIWKRTVASQMSASISENYNIIINISNRKELFIAKVEKLLFDGYKKIYDDKIKDDDEDNDIIVNDFIIDNIEESEILKYHKITVTEKYQNPPLRYTEASLIKKMEKSGIGRPSTYASIIETIIERKYIDKHDIKGKKIDIINYILEKDIIKEKTENTNVGGEKKKLVPTELGIHTNDFLEIHFFNILDSNFTAILEEKLDKISNNQIIWTDVLKDFYNEFKPNIDKLNEKESIIQNKNDKKRFVGIDENGKNVYSYIGQYGPVLQIGTGNKKDIKFIPIKEPYTINTITIDDINNMSVYPKILGNYNDHDILLKKGMYGIYFVHNNINYNYKTVKEEHDITLDDAIELINSKSDTKHVLIKKIDKYSIKNGPYGYYIHYNSKFYNIPTTYDIDTITKEICDTIIKIPKVYKKIS